MCGVVLVLGRRSCTRWDGVGKAAVLGEGAGQGDRGGWCAAAAGH